MSYDDFMMGTMKLNGIDHGLPKWEDFSATSSSQVFPRLKAAPVFVTPRHFI
jgi:hypothetical protein